MKRNIRFLVLMTMVLSLLGVTNAWGQYGLYGSSSVPSAAVYQAQQPAPSAQPAVVYPPIQQQPIPPQVAPNGPSLVAPSQRPTGNTPYPQQYASSPQQYQPHQSPASTPTYQPYQNLASTPVYHPYQPSAAPAYPSYHAMAPATGPYVNTPVQQQVQQPVQQQSTMYRMPTSPRFGVQGTPTAPRPQMPSITPLAPQQLPPQPAPSTEKIYPQPVALTDTNITNGSCGETPCETTCCESNPCCEPTCTLPWFASVSAMTLGRDQANRVWTSYQSTFEANQIMNTQDIKMPWAAGGEITFGRSFCCGMYGIEATYWQLAQVTGRASVTNPSGVSTPLDLRYLEVGPAGSEVLVSTLFDDAVEHRLARTNEAYNVELNFLYYGKPNQAFAGHTVNWLVGARFLKFDDDLLFSSLASGTWGESGGVNEGYLGDNVENSMVGFQVGFQARSPSWHRFSTFFTTKFGIYNNNIKNDFMLYRGDGYSATPQAGSGVTGNYPVHSTANVFSTIAEVNLGLEWNFNERLSAGVGYRLISISGIGLSDNQIPFYIVDIPEIERVDCNGDLLLHGGFASLTFGF